MRLVTVFFFNCWKKYKVATYSTYVVGITTGHGRTGGECVRPWRWSVDGVATAHRGQAAGHAWACTRAGRWATCMRARAEAKWKWTRAEAHQQPVTTTCRTARAAAAKGSAARMRCARTAGCDGNVHMPQPHARQRQVRPCLLSPKIQNLFKIFRHIESLDTCIQY